MSDHYEFWYSIETNEILRIYGCEIGENKMDINMFVNDLYVLYY